MSRWDQPSAPTNIILIHILYEFIIFMAYLERERLSGKGARAEMAKITEALGLQA